MEGNLVEEFKLGNTKIQFYNDAYVGKTTEDFKRSINNIESIGRRILLKIAKGEQVND